MRGSVALVAKTDLIIYEKRVRGYLIRDFEDRERIIVALLLEFDLDNLSVGFACVS